MNNLLFTALIIALLYYFFYYLPSQKKLNANLPLQHHQETQTEPTLIQNQAIEELKKAITQKEQTIIGLNNSYENAVSAKQKLEQKNTDNLKTIQELQSQIRDLTKRPLKPTNSKSTQTDNKDLENTLDTLIKDIQELNNEL